MQLTDQQTQQFQREGYLVLPAVFSNDEIARMAEEADKILDLVVNTTLALGRRSPRLDVQIRGGKMNIRKVQPINDMSEYLTSIANDERLIGPMRQLMSGHEPILMEEKLNYKQILYQDVPLEPFQTREFEDSFPLHHDWGYYRAQGYPGETLSSAVSIDASTENNGPLRIIPGTHSKDWPMLNPDPASGNGTVPEDLFPVEARIPIIAPAGSVMLFHAKLLHDSMPNESGRPRRIMIYSHYPGYHQAEPDQRNRYGRELGQQAEAEYRKLVADGEYTDRFHASNEPK